MTDHPGPDESTPAGPPAASPVHEQINLASRRLGWISLLLVVAGGWSIISGIRAHVFEVGPVTFALNEVSFTTVGDVTWFDVFRLHEFSVGVMLALMGVLGVVSLLSFHAWRGEGGRRIGSTESSTTSAATNGPSRLLGGLAVLLAVLGVVAIIIGLNHESESFAYRDYLAPTGWWAVIGPRSFDLGLVGVALALLALFARLTFSAWRFERRSVPVATVG